MDHLMREELIQWRDHGGAEDRERIISHLATCASCAASYAELIRTAPARQAPTRFNAQDFVKRGYAVRRDVPSGAWHSMVTSWKTWAGALSAAALVIFLLAPRPDSTTRSGQPVTPAPPGTAAGARITVMFQPGVANDVIQRTLSEVGGTVISGPSAQGVYVVELRRRSDNDTEIQRVLERLRSNAAVVRFAEREP